MDRSWKAEQLEEQRKSIQQAFAERMARFEKSEAAAKARREASQLPTPPDDPPKPAPAPAAE